ncbi:MAG: SDR family NAD(P)-dependent oxidoreductase [Deltaproteobacteria bacterium]|nr:SDR family NAD(P)-dependent oxidoreductase [Deltaproteobacteria bacterium]
MGLRDRLRQLASGPRYDGAVVATLGGIVDRLRDRSPPLSLSPLDRLDGRTALVTGANRGLGLAITVQLVARGAHVIMACRSGIPEIMDVVRRDATALAAEMRCGPAGTVDAVRLDLSDLTQVRAVADELAEDRVHLDVLVLNAGLVGMSSRKTKDGFDEMTQVNYLANVVFVMRLLERGVVPNSVFAKDADDADDASDAAPFTPRIVFVSSESHRSARPVELDRLGVYVEYGMRETVTEYGYQKLLVEMWAAELSRRLSPGGVLDVAVHTTCPGAVATDIAREAPAWVKPVLDPTIKHLFKKPEDGAVPIVWLAAARPVEGRTSLYVHVKNEKKRAAQADDPSKGAALWARSEAILERWRKA